MTDKFGTVPLPDPTEGSLLRVWYNPDDIPTAQQPQQPQAQQVVAFDALPNDDCVNGSLVDVNQHFVVYAVKNGLIRVLHRQSPLRSLLRGHTKKITDLAFFQSGDVLGSVGGNVIVWRIFERSPDIISEKLLEIPDTLPSVSRLIWHPFNPNQFWLVHQGSEETPQRNVATLTETTHITTVPHPAEQHALCSLYSDYVIMDGAVQLVATSSLTDLAWSGRDTRHVLTTHDDGRICLWDCKTLNRTSSGVVPVKCLFTLQEEEEGKQLARCLFLPHDNTAVNGNDPTAITSAFVTGSAGNTIVTLWSAFTESTLPTKLQVFGMKRPSTYNLSQCFGQTPTDGSPPSCFLLLSDRREGHVYCLHVKSSWSSVESPKKALAVGLDYVVPLSTKFPIYSWSIFGAPAEDVEDTNGGLNFDILFYAYQSKMVQKYVVAQYMLLSPNSIWDAATPGVTVSSVDVEPAYEEDYELDEEQIDDSQYDDAQNPSSLPAPDSLQADTSSDGDSNPFANWLGSLVGKKPASGASGTQAPPPTPITPSKAIVSGEVANTLPMPAANDRPVSAPAVRSASNSFLSPMELLSDIGSDLEQATGALPSTAQPVTKPAESKKKKKSAPKEFKKNLDAPVVILKREEATPSAASPVTETVPSSTMDTPQLESILERVLSSHFKKQEALLVERINKAVHSEIQTSVLPSLSKTVAQTMTAMNKTSRDEEKAQTKAVVKAVSGSVKAPLRDAFSESMKSVLIPAYESATREMFQQISDSIDKGVAARGPSTDVSSKLDSMAHAIESLSSEVEQLRSLVDFHGSGKFDNPDGEGSSTGVDKIEEVRNEVLALLQQSQYERAFTKAVSAEAAGLAIYCCENANLVEVLGGETPLLSQPILLCLMQQLGAVLVSSVDRALQTVIFWLQEIALSLDPINENIQRHVPSVLQQLVDSVNEKMAQGDPAMRRPLQKLLQVIRGLQR